MKIPGHFSAEINTPGEKSETVAKRVARARQIQADRYASLGAASIHTNAAAPANLIEQVVAPDGESRQLLLKAAEAFSLSARAYHRVLKVARTLADLAGSERVERPHIAEALSYRINMANA